MTNANTDPIADPAAQTLQQTGLDAEALQTCQAELKDFIAATHIRLQSLSEQLSNSQQLQAVNQDVHEIATTDRSAGCDDSLLTIEQCDAKDPRPIETTTDSPEHAIADDDPMERLNAIKLRLANQVQNAS